jgi:hypothetical protein
MSFFRFIRLLTLLLIIIGVGIYVQGQRLTTTNWASPVDVVVFPVNGDGSAATSAYIESLQPSAFDAIDRFFTAQARRYDVPETRPFVTRRGATVAERPPAPPLPQDSLLTRMTWSLKFRFWAWRHTPDSVSNYRRVRVFAVYHQPRDDNELPHSLGIQKGLLGLVHCYADTGSARHNHIVIAHEVLHTVGASDKYAADGRAVFPEGLAEPEKRPLFPQRFAEIMAGSVALSEIESLTPPSLRQCAVGPRTAREIGWTVQPSGSDG